MTRPPDIMNNLDPVSDLLQTRRCGIVADFDGSLSEIVRNPQDATLYADARQPLETLVKKLALVAVLSGRSADDINQKVAIDGIEMFGNHGAERIVNGRSEYAPGADSFRDALVEILEHLRSKVNYPGIVWEDKGLSLAVHYRPADDHVEARRVLSDALKNAPRKNELDIFWGKLILEIRAPTGINKGYAITKMATDWELDSVIFLGDDTTDLDAVNAVGAMNEAGNLKGVNIAVAQDDTPAKLFESCDYTVDGVPGVAVFLEWASRNA